MNRFEDVRINFNSRDWIEVLKYLARRQLDFRLANDDKEKDAIQTAFLRGQISFAKELINLEKDIMAAGNPAAR